MARIRPYLGGTKTALALGTHVRKQVFPLKEYFRSIDAFKAGIVAKRERVGGEGDDADTLLVMLSNLVDRDQEFLNYVDGKNYDMSGEDHEMKWRVACDALAWTIIHEYDKACSEGRWPE
jgi:hypothetical protein